MEAKELEKELEQRDGFAAFWAGVIHWFKKHEKKVYAGIGIAVVAYLAFWGYGQWSESKERAAWNEYEVILADLNKQKVDNEEQATKVRAEASAALTDLIKAHSSSAAARQAELELAALAASTGDFKTALGHYMAFHDSLSADDSMRLMLAQAIGQCHEGLKDWAAADQWYARLAADDNLAALGLWNMARVALLSGDKAKAEATYKKLLTDHPASSYTSRAKDQLALITG